MKNALQDFKLMLVYIFEYIVEGKKYSVVLKPIDAANGVILDEIPGQPGLMRGLTVSGGMVQIPIEGITNHFQSWWKLTNRTNQGVDTYYVDEAVVEHKVDRDHGKPEKWDENGCLKDIEGKESLPKDAKSSRIIRGK